jgi:membrane fusion protein (multidrug efflux system)
MNKSSLILSFNKKLFLALTLLFPATSVAQTPDPTVSTVVAHTQEWQDKIQAVGSLRAARGADLAAELSGIVDWIGFDSGSDVPAGTVLLRLRPNDDAAKIAELQAAVDLAQANLTRDGKQFRAQAVSQATIDADDSHVRAARAQLAQMQAVMAEKIIRAPFAGKLGLRQVDVGQFLPAGTTIVTLQALDPIFVDFYVPQQALPGVKQGEIAQVSVDGYPGRVFQAKISAVSPKLDAATRMAQIRATIENKDHALLPGMFANVSLSSGPAHRYVTLPSAAIVYNPYGSTVFVLNHASPPAVRAVTIKTGATRGDQVAITDGLQDGDIVVSAGQIKLHPGATVAVNNSVQPSNEPAPHPQEE